MIRGIVNAHLEATLRLKVRGPVGVEWDLDAVIDSGFSGPLTLPSAVVSNLGLPHQTSGSAILADGSLRQFEVYSAELDWDGAWRPVLIYVVGDEVLVGMRLLSRHVMQFEVVPGGSVEITAMP